MRRLVEHRIEQATFDEAVRGLVRNAPWWMTSLAIHAAAVVILLSIPYRVTRTAQQAAMRSEVQTPVEKPEDLAPVVPPEEPLPKKDIQEEPLDPVPDPQSRNEDDVDRQQFQETAGPDGTTEGPFTGPSTNGDIGLGGKAGGGPRGRGGATKMRVIGTTARTQRGVERGLAWLAKHQDVEDDGKWDCDDFFKHDKPDDRCDGSGGQLFDVGVTGLSLLAFLGAGYTDRGTTTENRYARTVRMGLRYLMSTQGEDGLFGPRATHSFIYNHAIATLALCEAYWMTRNPRYRKPAQMGLNYLAMHRNPYLAWRYDPRGGENDTSVTGWCVMALKSGNYAGLQVDPDALAGARLWIDKMTDPNFGQVGYNSPGGVPARPEGRQDRFPAEKSQSMTAVGILCRIFLGEDPRTSEAIRKGVKLCLALPPAWNPEDGSIDMYYWYYATLALFQVGGSAWRKWNAAMVEAVVESQHPEGDGARTGSWDPIGAWGDEGGRVYATATLVMCLEVYYRYDRVIGTGREALPAYQRR